MKWLSVLVGIILVSCVTAHRAPAPEFGGSSTHRESPPWNENGWQGHKELVQKARSGTTSVYFLGDSITRRWGATDYPEFLAHWKQNFQGWNASNFGWGGDTTHHILWRIKNGELDGVNPQVIVLLAGTNNLSSAADPQGVQDVLEGLKAIMDVCHRKAPRAKIILMALFPRNDTVDASRAVTEVNLRLPRLAEVISARLLNINDQLAASDGRLHPGMSPDQLHLSLAGYEVWAQNLKPLLQHYLGPPAAIDKAPPPTGDPGTAQKR